MVDVSIIIINYHSEKLVKECIQSICEKTEGLTYQIIIVDNDGDGRVFQELQAGTAEIVVVPSPENLGFGKANNLGEKYADGKYLFLLNPDTILLNNSIKILKDYYETTERAGIVGGNLYMEDGRPAPSHCLFFDSPEVEKKNASWKTILGNRILDKFFPHRQEDRRDSFNHSGSVINVAYIFGADIFMTKAIFEIVGGFDSDFFMYAEEEELSWRITKLGYDIFNVPQARIIHLDGGTMKAGQGFNEKQFGMRMNGLLTYYFKCFGVNGMKKGYEYRRLRYTRLQKYALFRKRRGSAVKLQRMIDCLDQQYEERRNSFAGDGEKHG